MTATISDEKTLVKAAKAEWIPKATDRCDRCGEASRAYSRATLGEMELMLCGHHTHQYETTLIASGWDLDIRLDILEEECRKYKSVSNEDADNA